MAIRYPILAHTLVAADPERLKVFLEGYEVLASCVRSEEPSLVDATHASMLRMLDKWALQDVERGKRERSMPGRVHLLGPRFSGVRGFFEGSGPVGWADADELPEMAAELRLLAAAQANVQPTLEGAARRIEEAAVDGLSVIGCVELLGYESDGRRSYFVRDYDFDDQLLE